ncbi:FAD-dependent oxidoreductase [Micromonospora chersina]
MAASRCQTTRGAAPWPRDKNEYDADTVLFAVGVEPATEWLKDKIDLGKKGIININHQQQTSAKDVYAGGDATLVPFAPVSEIAFLIPLTGTTRSFDNGECSFLVED